MQSLPLRKNPFKFDILPETVLKQWDSAKWGLSERNKRKTEIERVKNLRAGAVWTTTWPKVTRIATKATKIRDISVENSSVRWKLESGDFPQRISLSFYSWIEQIKAYLPPRYFIQ